MRVTRTYLEQTRPDAFRPAFGDFPDVAVERVVDPTPALSRHCYRTVGGAWHWRDRWDWCDDEIARHLARPEITLPRKTSRTSATNGTGALITMYR